MEIAKIQSTEASNAIEGIVTTNTRIKQLVEEKTTPMNRDEEEIAGYFRIKDMFPCTKIAVLSWFLAFERCFKMRKILKSKSGRENRIYRNP